MDAPGTPAQASITPARWRKAVAAAHARQAQQAPARPQPGCSGTFRHREA